MILSTKLFNLTIFMSKCVLKLLNKIFSSYHKFARGRVARMIVKCNFVSVLTDCKHSRHSRVDYALIVMCFIGDRKIGGNKLIQLP
jgi:hypothetical protein